MTAKNPATLRKNLLSDRHIVLGAACSVFLPYVITAVLMVFFSVYVLCRNRTRKLIFAYREAYVLPLFGTVASLTAAVHGNWLGLVIGIGLTLTLLFALYLRAVMTRLLFERMLSDACAMSLFGVVVAVIEKVAMRYYPLRYAPQCKSIYFNPNYFGTVCSLVIIICAYKVITRQEGRRRTYFIIAAVNALGIYLCGSMFAVVEVLVGVAVLLIMARRHKVLIIMLIAAAVGMFTVLLYPELLPKIIPRVGQAELTFNRRVRIWEASLQAIGTAPLFGRGGMSYHFLCEQYRATGQWPSYDPDFSLNLWHTHHAHNLILDPLLNFGVVGTALLAIYFARFAVSLIRNHYRHINPVASSLILAAMASSVVHGMVDMTLMWMQTGFLFLLILGGLGVLERKSERQEKKRFITLSDEQLHGIQSKTLDMIKYFKGFCERNGLTFFMCGGGCIGAVRNHGFIPWDDDLDVFMPREDYERLVGLWREQESGERYDLLKTDSERFCGNIFTTMVDRKTTAVRPQLAQLDIPQGLVIDIFPIDGCPADRGERRKQKLWAMVYSLFMSQVVPVKHGGIMAIGSRALLMLVPFASWRYKLWRLAERKMSKYKISDCTKITELCAGVGYMQNEYPADAFASAVMMPFEDTQLPVPVGYDAYLRIAFGDYMTPPPPEKQTTEHDLLFLDLENGSDIYRGDKFCVRAKRD